MASDIFNLDFFEGIGRVPTESIDLVFADPPYFLSNGGFSVSGGKQVSVDKGSWDMATSKEEARRFHSRWIGECARVLKPNGSLVVSGTYHSIFTCGVAIEDAGMKILNDIVWFKPNGAPNLSGRRLAASHETLIWAAKSENSKFTFNYEDLKLGSFPDDAIKRPGKQMRSVWWIPNTPAREKTFGRHPTQKPLALMERVVVAFSNSGDTVLDPFMGSGSTGVACKSLGRSFIGFELDTDFYSLAQKRLGKL